MFLRAPKPGQAGLASSTHQVPKPSARRFKHFQLVWGNDPSVLQPSYAKADEIRPRRVHTVSPGRCQARKAPISAQYPRCLQPPDHNYSSALFPPRAVGICQHIIVHRHRPSSFCLGEPSSQILRSPRRDTNAWKKNQGRAVQSRRVVNYINTADTDWPRAGGTLSSCAAAPRCF